MPESGGLPRRSRRYDALSPAQMSGSERSQRGQFSADRQSVPMQHRVGSKQSSGEQDTMLQRGGKRSRAARRRNLWQILFGQGSKQPSRRSMLQQATRQDARTAKVDPPRDFLQRLKRGERSPLTNEQAAAKRAEEQVRQAVLGRSRQLNGLSPRDGFAPAVSAMPLRGKRSNAKQAPTRQSNAPVQSGSRAIPAFQSSPQSGGHDRGTPPANPSAQRREQRARNRRGSTQRHRGLGLAEQSQRMDMKARSSAPERQRETTPRSPGLSAGLYAARMLILSVGVGVLVGTMLSMLDPASRLTAGASQQATKKADSAERAQATQATATSQAGLQTDNLAATQLPKTGQELAPLKATLQTLTLQSPQFTPGIFLFDLDTNDFVDLNGGASFAAASTIKVPILVAFLQDVDAGKIQLDELLTMQKELVAGGSGELQGLPAGTKVTALETVTKMITISDNTATNMVIARLGGMAALDQRFRSWGLVSTGLNSLLPDLNGTNTTSPKDMALLMARISQGELVSMRSRDRMLDIMQRTVNHSQLSQGLGKGATIAHKTGDIGGLIGDVGLIDMPSGKRYSLTVLVKRSFNDDSAYDLVPKLSRAVYQYLNRVPAAQSSPTAEPSAPSEPSSPRADSGTPTAPDRAPSRPTDTAITQSPSLDTAAR